MELFTKTKVVKLRSHLDKYLLAEDGGETVRQGRIGNVSTSRRSKWVVEVVDTRENAIRLRNLSGKYLKASDAPFLLGVTGMKVIQTTPEKPNDWKLEWEVIRDGFQVKLKSWCGKFLRANGGTPPWRNSVTHDEPHTGATARWVLWDVEMVEGGEATESVAEYLSFVSSFSSVSEDVLEAVSDGHSLDGSTPGSPGSGSGSGSPMVGRTPRFNVLRSFSPRISPKKLTNSRIGMDFFHNAKAVRLRSYHDKYLHAEDDEESVTQDRNGSSKNARWTVEPVPGSQSIIRLKSCYGKYLTASNQPFLLGMTGRKVLQTVPTRLDSSVEWEPVGDGNQVKLKTRYGNFLRANGGPPPWRNSVTHDIPHRTATQDWVLWDVHVVEIEVVHSPVGPQESKPLPLHQDPLDFESTSPSSASAPSGHFSRQESSDSYVSSPPKPEGRTIYYHVADERGEVGEEVVEGCFLVFKGNGVEELTHKLKEETGLADIVVCTRSPLNGKLYPLRLQLPPNNVDMHVVVVETSSRVARDFAKIAL